MEFLRKIYNHSLVELGKLCRVSAATFLGPLVGDTVPERAFVTDHRIRTAHSQPQL